jgi:hypothetical protein
MQTIQEGHIQRQPDTAERDTKQTASIAAALCQRLFGGR